MAPPDFSEFTKLEKLTHIGELLDNAIGKPKYGRPEMKYQVESQLSKIERKGGFQVFRIKENHEI